MRFTTSKQDLLTLDVQKLISEKVQSLKIIGDNIDLEVPLVFFEEAGEKAVKSPISMNAFPAILNRFEEIYKTQAAFAGFKKLTKFPLLYNRLMNVTSRKHKYYISLTKT